MINCPWHLFSLGDYRWPSNAANELGSYDPLLTPHPADLAVGADAATRQQAYGALMLDTLDPEELKLIRLRLQRQPALGTDRFRAMSEAQLDRRAGPAKMGRPRKSQLFSEGVEKVHPDHEP